MKQTCYTEILVHPAVARWMDNEFTRKGGAYDLCSHYLYTLLCCGLRHRKLKSRDHCTGQQRTRRVKIMLRPWDASHYGEHIPEKFQAGFSRCCHRLILHCACHEIMLSHLLCGIPRDTAIKDYIARNLYNEDELNYPALRKHYQRHWMQKEREFYLPDNITKRADPRQVSVTNKIVGNVPF